MMKYNIDNRELLRLNRAYQIVSKCNQILVKTHNERQLMRQVCAVLVEDGGYPAAWVGLCDFSRERKIIPAAGRGIPQKTLDSICVSWRDDIYGKGPAGTAVKRGTPVVCRNIETDPHYAPWKKQAEEIGYQSVIALPLRGKKNVIGVLIIYAEGEDAFSDHEQHMLQELADDLSYGIETTKQNEERERDKRELQERIKELQGVFRLNNCVDTSRNIEEILREFTLEILPYSMQYPDIVDCIVEFDSRTYRNKEQRGISANSYTVPIYVQKKQRGKISIAYPELDAFEIETVEYSVIHAFADKIGKAITRIEAQEQLEESRKRSQNILDSMPDIIFEIDMDMRITWANKKAVEAANNPIGQFCYTAYHGRSKPCPNCPSVKALQTGEIKHGNVYFSEGSGRDSEQFLENIGVPILDPEENILGVMEITRDITKNHQAQEKMKRYNKELRNLSHHLQLVREEERKNISREIHDELGQALTAIKMDAYWIHKHTPETETKLLKKSENMLSLLDDTVLNVQKLINDLRLGIPEGLDFHSALEWEIEDFQKRSGIQVNFTLGHFSESIDPQSSITAYRILQESLTNISRHAAAGNVNIQIGYRNDCIEISIRDDGLGISDKELYSPHSYGIIGMRERCLILGGHLEIESGPGKGTQLTAVIPVQPIFE